MANHIFFFHVEEDDCMVFDSRERCLGCGRCMESARKCTCIVCVCSFVNLYALSVSFPAVRHISTDNPIPHLICPSILGARIAPTGQEQRQILSRPPSSPVDPGNKWKLLRLEGLKGEGRKAMPRSPFHSLAQDAVALRGSGTV